MDKVLAALPGLEVPNLTGGMAKLLPNHHHRRFSSAMKADGQFNTVEDHCLGRRCLVGLLPGSKDIEADWVTPRGNYNTKTKTCSGQNYSDLTPFLGWRARALRPGRGNRGARAARPLCAPGPCVALAPSVAQPLPEAGLCCRAGELREAGFAAEATVDRLSASGRPSAGGGRCAARRRPFYRTDQKVHRDGGRQPHLVRARRSGVAR